MSWVLLLQIILLLIITTLLIIATVGSIIDDIYKGRIKRDAHRYRNYRDVQL